MSLSPEVLQQRYAAIELAYSERLWPDVERLSAALLAELPESPADPLRLRLGLLLGHTRLYGWGDGGAARAHYSGVLAHSQEPTLREIAQQGLEQCQQLEQAQRQGEAQAAPQGQASESSGNEPATAAAPWLADLNPGTAPSGPAAEQATAAGGNAAPWLQSGTSATPMPAATAQTPSEPMEAEPAGETASATVAEELAEELAEVPEESQVSEESLVPEENRLQEENRVQERNRAEPDAPAPAIALALNSVEIVEEPEQIAVALADPSRREEIALHELADDPSDPLHLDETALSAEELAALNRGLLRVVLS